MPRRAILLADAQNDLDEVAYESTAVSNAVKRLLLGGDPVEVYRQFREDQVQQGWLLDSNGGTEFETESWENGWQTMLVGTRYIWYRPLSQAELDGLGRTDRGLGLSDALVSRIVSWRVRPG